MRFSLLIAAGWLLAAVPLLAQPAALTVNTSSREEVRQFYRAIYSASEKVPMGWTGSYATSNAGDNDDWGGTAALITAFTAVAAVGLPANSKDAALVATLFQGSYTVQVSGVGGTTDAALVEVYAVQ